MKTCYINVSPEQVKDSLQIVKDKNPDSVLVLAPVCGIEMRAPTKKKPFHRIKVEVVVPEYLKLIDKPDEETNLWK